MRLFVGHFMFLLLTAAPCHVFGYKILGFFPYCIRSHYNVFSPLMLELVNRGHSVVVYTPFPSETVLSNNNYSEVDCSYCFRHLKYLRNPIDVNFIYEKMTDTDMLSTFLFLFGHVETVGRAMLECEPVLKLLTSPQSDDFDISIAETFLTDLNIGLVSKLKAPYVGFHTSQLLPWLATKYANPWNPSYVATIYGYLSEMSFTQRLHNTFISLMVILLYHKYPAAITKELITQFPGRPVHSMTQVARNCSLLLLHANLVVNPIQPLLPAIVEIGGINVKKKSDLLPQDIEKFINESEHGVVYFCMGSLLKGSSFPEDKRNAFLYAFSKIPQRVLWKWEGDVLPGKSNNIMTAKWMPQRDILAHPKVKLFISHGGLLGTNEAVYEGVPILGIPIFGDQRTNVKSIEASGAGEMLDYNEISKEIVLEKVQRLLNDPKYHENAKELSRRYRDRPMSPLDTAVYWTEYVIRHKGAHHLRSAAVDMAWYQYLLLDVIAFVIFVLVISLVIVYYSLKLTLRFVLNKFIKKQTGVGNDKKVKSN